MQIVSALDVHRRQITFRTLDLVSGESRRAVPAYIAKYDTGSGGTRIDTVPGTFAQKLTAARLGLGGGPAFDLGFTVMKVSSVAIHVLIVLAVASAIVHVVRRSRL